MVQEQIAGFRISPEQQYLWRRTHETAENPYRILGQIHIESAFQLEILRKALHYVVQRHEILRTSFRVLPGLAVPVQIIIEAGEIQPAFYDFSDLSPATQETKLQELITHILHQPVDLASPVWLTCTLVTFEPQRHLLVIMFPAISGDVATLKHLTRELLEAYEMYASGKEEAPESSDVMQYADLAEWRHEFLHLEENHDERDYWLTAQHWRFSQVPTLSSEASDVSMHAAMIRHTLPDSLREMLENFGQRQDVADLSAVLLSAWVITLKRLNEEVDPTFFLACDLRKEYVELTGALGPLTHYVPLSISLDLKQSFTEVVRGVRESLQQPIAYHQYYSSDMLETSREEGSETASTSALSFAFEDFSRSTETKHTSLSWHLKDLYTCIDQHAMQIVWVKRENELVLHCLYNTQILAVEETERHIEQYLTLLSALLTQWTVPVEALPIVGSREWQEIIIACNQTAQPSSWDMSLHQHFEQQALRTPDRIAVYDGDSALSYATVLKRIRQLSWRLRGLGIQQEVPVGIYMERSSSLLIAILSVLYAGGVYVPLDTAYPPERLAWIAHNAAFPLCLTQDTLVEHFPELGTTCQIIAESNWASDEQAPELEGAEVSSESLAYILYTSGSTGQPKGVMVSQRGAMHYLSWCLARYFPEGGQGAPVHSSIAFDLTVTSLFAPLLAGQGITLVQQGPGVENLAQILLERGPFSFVKVTPAHLELLRRSIPPTDIASIASVLLVGGEQLYYELLQFWHTHASDIRVINEYGPTEAVVGCSTFEVTEPTLQAGSVPIGSPIHNTQLYVLNRFMLPVPFMVPGELYIGGEGLARGYLTSPELTAERFLPDPFSTRPGARLYRTGDMVRRRLDGTLEYLGRLDHQVKVRGFRVELAEIEATLLELPGVQEVTVLLRKEATGVHRLVAYVVAQAGYSLTAEELRESLARKLPEYMHPSAWVMLEKTPLTAHGKVDRQALLELTPQESWIEHEEAEEPCSFVEEILIDIWRQVLSVEYIGLHDNFFVRGGHSILATVAISRLRDALGIDVPVRLMFEAPTIAEMARYVEMLRLQTQDKQGSTLLARPEADTAPLTYAQERLWHLYELAPESPRWNNLLSFHLQGRLHEGALRKSLQSLIERHAILRSHFTVLEGQPVQIVAPHTDLAYTWIDLSALPDEKREAQIQQLLIQDRLLPIDLRTGPLMRVALVRLSEVEHYLLITTHHIVYDGWSRGILYRDLAELYSAQLTARQPTLPSLPLSYHDFAYWQRHWLQGQVLDTQLSYWLNYLAGAPPLLHFPWDFPRPAVQTFETSRQHFELPPVLTQALKGLSDSSGVTLFMTLMASFQTLLYRYTGQEDMVVAFPVANRDRTEIENVFGLFADVLLLRSRFTNQTSFQMLLQQVREGFIGAYTNHDIPFMKIFEAFKVQRHPSYNPLFQVLFEFLLMPGRQLALQHLTTSPVIVEKRQSDLDLYLSMWEEAGTLQGLLAYNTALFRAETIRSILQCFEILLQSIVDTPQQALALLPIMTSSEETQLRSQSVRSQVLSAMKKKLLRHAEEEEK